MIVTCPSCAARFTVDDSALGPEGRKVKCSKCGNIWLQLPSLAPAEPSGEDPPLPGDPAEPAKPERPPLAPRPRRAAPPRAKRRAAAAVTWVLFLAVLTAAIGGAYWFRADIMRSLPATAQIYAAFGLVPRSIFEGLDLTDVTWKQEETAGGENVLRITGKVVNRSESPKDVPELAGVLYDEENNALHSWTFTAPEPRRLLPSEDVTFNTQVTNPDTKAARLTIRFNGAAAH